MNRTDTMCPRCAHQTLNQLYTSPVPGVWEVLQCAQCLYTWRTSEPARRTQRDAYPEQFKMTIEDIANAPEVPTVPPLRAESAKHAVQDWVPELPAGVQSPAA
jgi:vanillate/4-hydroxybenzoate decarboxylase subunit D